MVDHPNASPLGKLSPPLSCRPDNYSTKQRQPSQSIASADGSRHSSVALHHNPGDSAYNENDLHLLVDLVTLQMDGKSPRGISRVWTSVLDLFLKDLQYRAANGLCVTLLVRGQRSNSTSEHALFDATKVLTKPAQILEVPPYIPGSYDEQMLACICRSLKADVFISTLYSRPAVPSSGSPPQQFCKQVLLLHDLTPEKFGWDMSKVSE